MIHLCGDIPSIAATSAGSHVNVATIVTSAVPVLQASANVAVIVLEVLLQVAAAVIATASPVKAVRSIQLESQDVGKGQTVTMSRKSFHEEDGTLHNREQLSLPHTGSGTTRVQPQKPRCCLSRPLMHIWTDNNVEDPASLPLNYMF